MEPEEPPVEEPMDPAAPVEADAGANGEGADGGISLVPDEEGSHHQSNAAGGCSVVTPGAGAGAAPAWLLLGLLGLGLRRRRARGISAE